ncbi:hypothetical protein [Nocardioides sp.]|uniref:hypothetical protein n=1 Tax=Nocardioides sp. TaxID=35761 RepID=UPI002C583DB1|nr:hypothetical protein [Nocardioides sp.]HXH78411.1 hypothetical protein [Nocardioides sp.]
MTNARGLSTLAAAALVVSALAGCSEDPASTTTPTESPSSLTPSSGATTEPPSDSELAEEAASQVVTDYIATVDRLRKDRKEPLGELKAVAIGGELAAQEIFTRNQRKAGNRQTGDTDVVDVVVQSVNLDNSDPQAGKLPTVQLDVCWDVSGGDVLDRDGNSIVSADRPERGWTRYTVVNHTWKKHPDDGWRVATSQDLEKAPCSAA